MIAIGQSDPEAIAVDADQRHLQHFALLNSSSIM
jgi:hypothetical protein